MFFFNQLSIKTRLAIGYTIMGIDLLLVAALGIYAESKTQANFDNQVNGINVITAQANEVIDAVNARAIGARNLVIANSPEAIQRHVSDILAAHQNVQAAFTDLRRSVVTIPRTGEQLAQLTTEAARTEEVYAAIALEITRLGSQGQREIAIEKINKECAPLLKQLSGQLYAVLAESVRIGNATLIASRADFESTRLMLILFSVFMIGLALTMGAATTRSITRPLGEASSAVTAFSRGDLARPLSTSGRDEISALLNALEDMRQNLIRLVAHVREDAHSVSTASSEIAQGNQDLSTRTEQQASALEQTASAMEELGSTVRQNADNAREANQLAQNASSVAARGGEAVSQVVQTMHGITESSHKINDIISVIDGIAFQTNILALNAAVEAARAGEQGRGFAVVAGEVRSLASRSAEAAKEIKTLITDSVQRVERGSTLVDQAGTTMGEVVGSIRRVTDIMGEISTASSEQSRGVNQVSEAVALIDQATQQNAALVEEMAAAAGSLKSQAMDMVQTVAVFTLGSPANSAFPALHHA